MFWQYHNGIEHLSTKYSINPKFAIMSALDKKNTCAK